ncbi:hypothetical protein C8F01DRAFT_1094221 [Mycena amicta]|nr:hypothetical protein C8F01DRAFT_1094221 [Mycena amicta]
MAPFRPKTFRDINHLIPVDRRLATSALWCNVIPLSLPGARIPSRRARSQRFLSVHNCMTRVLEAEEALAILTTNDNRLHYRSYLLAALLYRLCSSIGLRLKHYSNLEHTKVTSNMQAAFALAADVLITVGLCWRLNQGRTGMQSGQTLWPAATGLSVAYQPAYQLAYQLACRGTRQMKQTHAKPDATQSKLSLHLDGILPQMQHIYQTRHLHLRRPEAGNQHIMMVSWLDVGWLAVRVNWLVVSVRG